MRSFWVYILRCNNGSFYTGVTHCLEERLTLHQNGADRNCYTWKRRPVVLAYSHEFDSINEAIRWEKQIKGWSRKKKLALIAGNFDLLHTHAMSTEKKNRVSKNIKQN